MKNQNIRYEEIKLYLSDAKTCKEFNEYSRFVFRVYGIKVKTIEDIAKIDVKLYQIFNDAYETIMESNAADNNF